MRVQYYFSIIRHVSIFLLYLICCDILRHLKKKKLAQQDDQVATGVAKYNIQKNTQKNN